MTTGTTDAELVHLTRSGNAEAYGELVARYQGHVYGLAYSLAGDWTDAQDIAQEAFIRAYANLDQLREPGRFAAWLRRVSFSVAMNWLKAFRPGLFQQLDNRVDLESLEIPDFRPGPAEVVEKRQLAEAVRRAIASLPAKYRMPLTMFHLDGLSYQKVADFLDIPLGTAKGLIHRARQKLKLALAAYAGEELTPMVQEVFNEHKLSEEFAGKVLENIADLDWQEGESTFAGSVVACMEFLREPTTYDFVAGVSGAAFKLLWYPGWCPSNNDLLIFGEEPIRQTFRALGYQYERVPSSEAGEGGDAFRGKIIESIQKGRPVIAQGIVGPECCVVAGYDQNGDVLLGRSYFHDGSRGYYRETDWLANCHGLILIGEKQERPAREEILREALQWALHLVHTPQVNGRASGLAAYDAWAGALLRDEDFPAGDLETLTFRCNVSASVTLAGLWDARKAAAGFLRNMADAGPAAAAAVLQAADAYAQEFRVLDHAMGVAPFCTDREEKRLQMADPNLRQELAGLVRQAKEKDQEATAHLARALQQIESRRCRARES